MEVKPSGSGGRRKWLRPRALLTATMVVGMLAGLMVSSAGAATVVKPAAVLGSGSDVMYHVSSALDLLYNESPGCTVIAPSGTQPLDLSCDPQTGDVTTEDYAHDRISEAAPIGGSAGISQLCQQGLAGIAKINYVRQTSAPNSSACTGLFYVAYARDALTFETFPGASGAAFQPGDNQGLPLSGSCTGVTTDLCLSQAQLQGIFVSCTITNWSQVGGANAPIKIFTILPQFGTRKAWDTFIGGSSSSCPNVTLVDQTDNSEIPASAQADAIVPVSVGSWNERYGSNPGNSDIGDIDGVVPSLANIQNGSFPYSRFLYNVYCNSATCGSGKKATAQTIKYVGFNGWICKATAHANDPVTGVDYRTEIANTIKQYGFAPVPLGATGGGVTTTNYCRLFKT